MVSDEVHFYLNGQVNSKNYILCGRQFKTLQELRDSITADIRAIPLHRMPNVKCARKCIDQNGRPVENLL